MTTGENFDHQNKVRWRTFLKDVFICSLGAYGGPEAHYGVFTDQLVVKKKYLAEEDLVELIALTGILPGPSSTQTIIAIGHKVVTNRMTLLLLVFGGIVTYIIRAPWIYPLVLIFGGVVSVVTSKEKELWHRVKINPPWRYLFIFGFFAISSLLLSIIWDSKIIQIFESFYRYGYLVIGGGQVVVPMMYSELVEINQYMTSQEFLTGFGLVQGLPGPMFSFCAYAGGMASRGGSPLVQVLGAVAGSIAIFLPGMLLIFFVYPIWEKLRAIKGIKVSLKGITAVAGGLITVAAIILMQQSGFTFDNFLVLFMTVLLLLTKKVPAPLIVIVVLAAGFII